MSLATRCTSCGTVFRVVQDQLKISDGWVRCGQCSEVFNALEALFDIDRDTAGAPAASGESGAPSSTPTPSRGPEGAELPPTDAAPVARIDASPDIARVASAASELPVSLADMPADDDPFEPPAFSDTDVMMSPEELAALTGVEVVSPVDADPVVERFAAPAPVATPAPAAAAPPARLGRDRPRTTAKRPPPPPTAAVAPPGIDIDVDLPSAIEVLRPSKAPSRRSSSRQRPDFTDARFDSDSGESDVDVDAEIAAAMDSDSMRERTRRPEFVRRADRAARWKSRPAKVGLALLSCVAGAALGAQVTHHFRDDAAARWPAAKPALQAWCSLVGCSVDAPRAIDDVAVESTTLTQGDSADSFKLAVLLRSRARVALMTPSVSLTLTDLNGKLISRKVLSPADFRVPAVMRPNAEITMKATLRTPDTRATGYTVETFYP